MSTPLKLQRKTFPRRGVLRNGNPTNRSSSTSSSQSLRGRRRQPTRPLKSNKSPSRNYTKKQGASETSRHHTRTPSSTSPSQSFRGRRRQPTKSLNSNKQGTARTGETSRHNTRIGVVEWKGLEVADHKIVWPPMVVIQNTRSHKDESGKALGKFELKENNFGHGHGLIKNFCAASLFIITIYWHRCLYCHKCSCTEPNIHCLVPGLCLGFVWRSQSMACEEAATGKEVEEMGRIKKQAKEKWSSLNRRAVSTYNSKWWTGPSLDRSKK